MASIYTLWQLDTEERASSYLTNLAGKPIVLHNFIGNKFFKHSARYEWIDSLNPRSGELLAQMPRSGPSDVNHAVDVASQVFSSWSQTSRHERSEILLRIAPLVEEKKELFAAWESIDQGKTLARARIEVDRAISNFRLVLLVTAYF